MAKSKDILSYIDRLLGQHNYGKAISLLEETLEQESPKPSLYRKLAACYLGKGDRDRALDVLKKGTSLFPTDIPMAEGYAELLRFSDRIEEAEQVYRSLIEALPARRKSEKSDIYTELGDMLWLYPGKYHEAIIAWEKAFETDEENLLAQKHMEDAAKWKEEEWDVIKNVCRIILKLKDDRTAADDLSVPWLREQYEWANRLSQVVVTEEQYYFLLYFYEIDLFDWLINLPFKLVRNHLEEEAFELGEKWAKFENRSDFLADRAVFLAEAGRREQAHAQMDELLHEFPEDVWARIKMGDAYLALGDMQSAEHTYRHAMTLSDEGYDREGVLERLVPMLKEQGRNEEAKKLEEWYTESQASMTAPPGDPVMPVRTGEKIGRNDPCPCGSGKKYKKCCGA